MSGMDWLSNSFLMSVGVCAVSSLGIFAVNKLGVFTDDMNMLQNLQQQRRR